MSTLVKLLDGREVSSDSEEWRHLCEARTVAAMPTIEARREYLKAVEYQRGVAVRLALQATIVAIWDARHGSR